MDSEIEKDVGTHSTTDDGIPLTSLDADNFKLPSPGHALQPDVASVLDQFNDDDFTSDGDGHQLQTDNACDGDKINDSKEPEENSDDSRPGVMIVKMMMHQMMGPPSQ